MLVTQSQKAVRGSAGSSPVPLSLLVISPAPHIPGGVSAFAEMMKPRLHFRHVFSYYVGSEPGRRESALSIATRLISAPFAVVRMVKRHSIDVVHINPGFDYKSLLRDGLILVALRLAGFRKIVVYFHGWSPRVAEHFRRSRILRSLLAWVLRDCSILVLSPDFKQALIAMGIEGARIAVTRTMFDGPLFSECVPQHTVRQSILFLSRFERKKGMYELVDAFMRLACDFPAWELVLAGDGEEMVPLRQYVATLDAADRIHFPGYVHGVEKARLFREAALFVLPSRMGEGMPIVLLEAMAAGKPVITGRAGGIAHIIRSPENGIVLDEVSVASLEEALRGMLNDAACRARVASHNHDYAWKHFEADIVTAELAGIFQKVANA